MPYRSYDFNRIYDNFLEVYGSEGEEAYYTWLNGLRLDESKAYAQARESYRWRKEDLQFVREDADAKYYEVEVGFPTKSMNGNVYREHDLVAAASTLKGKHPSLNHKNEFWFSPKNPRNRWGNIEIVDGKFHEGICKALVRVPKETICPICHGAPMTELIDNKKIVNVSLEGDCINGRCADGTCEGFYFTDPPFTFLTTDVLPGIPMTRIKPLESYMPIHKSQSSLNIEERKQTVIKIKPKIIEDTNQNSQQPPVDVNTKSIVTDLRGDWGTPITNDNIHSQTQSSGNVTVPVGTSAGTHQMQSGYGVANKKPPVPKSSESTEPAEATAECSCPAGEHRNKNGDCVPNEAAEQTEQVAEKSEPDRGTDPPRNTPSNDPPKGEPGAGGPPKSKPLTYSYDQMPPGAPATLPTSVTPKIDIGKQSKGIAKGVPIGTSPVEALPSLEERKARIKADLKAADAEDKALKWEQMHNETYAKLTELTASYTELDRQHQALKAEVKQEREEANTRLETFIAQTTSKMEGLIAKAEQHKMQYDSVCGELKQAKLDLEEARREALTNRNEADKAWEQAKKSTLIATKANEDYIELAHKNEELTEAMRRKDILAKKTLKIRA